MCGIVGFCGKQSAAPIVFEALKHVEYRGYDSAGIAALFNGQLLVKKDIGKLNEIETKHDLTSLPGNIAIGHTRWATHGGVTSANAHPHCDCNGTIAVVHNGTIDNYQELRQELTSNGHQLASETDTEVIPHLIEDELKGACSLEAAVLAIVPKLEGSYAFLAISSHDPGKVVGARKGGPLVIGISKRGSFAGSDALAFPDYVNQLIPLDDGEMVVMRQNVAELFDAAGNKLQKTTRQLASKWGGSDKQGYQFFMLKEILEQPQILEDAVCQDKELFTEIALDILRAEQVIVTACGTSRYAALVGRYLFSKVGRKFCDVVMASEFHYFADSVDKNTLVLAVSQSGETADVIEGVKRAKAAGAKVVSIINRPLSLLSDMSHHIIYLNCGPELCVAATKSFLSQLVVFYLLSFSMVNSFDKAVNDLKNVSNEIAKAIDWNNDQLNKLSKSLKDKKDFYYIARGINFAIASEGALKLKEISYIHAEGMPAGELKHGTLALIEPQTPVAVICPGDYTYRETLSNAIEAKSRGAYIIAISDVENEVYDFWVKIPKVDELLYPIVTVVPLQLLAYHLAVSLGHDPDRPRNLAKSVTVK
ncbi:MAG TPA: glutamine--fructose-6-phosphate transaminase (isomerizing) [Dehalococcoidia bacterium]|nr:glutamine--fructose-6-phosphate transaminase (isomerizing) [Dehalococcoidia bacterium]